MCPSYGRAGRRAAHLTDPPSARFSLRPTHDKGGWPVAPARKNSVFSDRDRRPAGSSGTYQRLPPPRLPPPMLLLPPIGAGAAFVTTTFLACGPLLPWPASTSNSTSSP